MNPQYTYAALHVCAFTFPFILSFDKKVAFYKKWKYLFPAILIVAAVFVIWDIYFTHLGVWSFNDNYITGIRLSNLPWEEVLFFITIPYCCLFIYECVLAYFPKYSFEFFGKSEGLALGILTLAIGLLNTDKYYTSWSALGASALLFYMWYKKFSWNGKFWISYIIVLIPFFICNGILTSQPVVIYNNDENLALRMYTIPVEDLMYNLIMLLGVTILYEKFRTADKSKSA
ncbi:MAG: hypothetical protein Fur0041_05440 [Bacteroidia bacterium]